MKTIEKRNLRSPFLIVNPKAYIYGQESLELALVCEELTKEYDIDIVFTAQHVDLRMIAEKTEKIVLTAQHMDGIVPGRGMGHILPEGIVEAGAQAVVLNHAEHPLSVTALGKAMARAKELNLITIVCADTVAECTAIAKLDPDVMICEPTSLIGTGKTSDDEYILSTTKAVRDVNPYVKILQAAGVTTGEDVYRVIMQGADASGGTSGILNAPSRKGRIIEMLEAIKKSKKDKRRDL